MLTDKMCLFKEFYKATEFKSMSARQQHAYFCCEEQESLKDVTVSLIWKKKKRTSLGLASGKNLQQTSEVRLVTAQDFLMDLS